MIAGIIVFVIVPILIMWFCISFSKWLGEAIFGKGEEKHTFVSHNVHHHYHTHNDHSQHVSIIDEDSKNRILELKESKEIDQFKNNNCPNCKYFQTNIFKKKVKECEDCKRL